LADREETDRAGIALAFVLAHPARPVPILGTTKPERLRQAVAATGIALDRTDCYRIVEASTGKKLP
jgi:predicted oxidoreductase